MEPNKFDYDIIIIGAGIGGVTAGNILAKSGLRVLILEKNHAAGGAVSTFYRNGYPIDISHSLCAVREGAIVRRYFEYLGIYDKLEFIELDKAFIYMRDQQKPPIFCYTDLDRYAEELSVIFPQEAKNIKALFKEVTEIWKKEVLNSYYSPSLPQLLSYPFLFPRLFKYRNYTFEQFLSRFTNNSELKEVISAGWPYLGLRKESVSALYMICLLGVYHQEKSYFVKGGFGEIVKSLVYNFEKLGGRILLNTEAGEIILKDKNTAYGVRDKDGRNYYAKKIISNADSKRTFIELIKNKNILPQKLINKIKSAKMSCSAIQVHLAAESEIDKEYLSAGSIVLPFQIDLEAKLKLLFKSKDSNHAARAIMLSIHPLTDFLNTEEKNIYIFNIGYLPASYDLWDNFISTYKDNNEYKSIKKEIGDLVVKEMKKFWSIKNLRFINTLTPVSFEKWLGASEGAIYDLANIPKQSVLSRLEYTSGIKNLYLVGAKTFQGNCPKESLTVSNSFRHSPL